MTDTEVNRVLAERAVTGHVLAVDGGKATGYAFYDLAARAAYFGEWPFEDGLLAVYAWAENHRGCGAADVIVPERFVITVGTATKSPGSWTMETNGACRLAALKFGLSLDDSQTARHAKGFCGDDMLRDLGWWTAGSDHARDAGRHLATYLARKEIGHFDQLLRAAGR
jgi:hypothetical protein